MVVDDFLLVLVTVAPGVIVIDATARIPPRTQVPRDLPVDGDGS